MLPRHLVTNRLDDSLLQLFDQPAGLVLGAAFLNNDSFGNTRMITLVPAPEGVMVYVKKLTDLAEGFALLAELNRLLPEKFLLLHAELACVCIHASIILNVNCYRISRTCGCLAFFNI